MASAYPERQESAGVWEDLVFEPDHVELLEMVGIGGCGEVYHAQHIKYGILAVKKLGVTHMKDGYSIFL